MPEQSVPDIYTLTGSESALPLVFDSPHSGRGYPADFDYACPLHTLEENEDRYVDLLFESAPSAGAALLCASFPRTYIDPNRAVTDIDPELLADQWPGIIEPSSRAQQGIGLVFRLNALGAPIYNRPLGVAEIQGRIEHYYRPYHRALKKILDESSDRFGQVWHINCHSMPSRYFSSGPPDFILGDRHGTTCDPDFTLAVQGFLRGLGYHVVLNDTYPGGELVRSYADPAQGRHSLQIEISKALYLDEKTNKKSDGFDALKKNIDKLTCFLADFTQRQVLPLAAD